MNCRYCEHCDIGCLDIVGERSNYYFCNRLHERIIDFEHPLCQSPNATDDTKNSEGYPDPTASAAIRNIEQAEAEDRKFRRLLKGIFNLCDLAGMEIQGRIVIKSKKTGRVWR